MSEEIQCPECGGKLKVWVDVNSRVEFEVRSAGRLSKPTVETSDNGECRLGIECKSCDWQMHGMDDGIEDYTDVIELAGERAEGIQFSVKRKA